MDTKFNTSELIEYLDGLFNFHLTHFYNYDEENNGKLEEIKMILLEDEKRRNYANHLLLEDELLENEINFEAGGVDNYIPEEPCKECRVNYDILKEGENDKKQ
jgi:hypothetical protein